MDTETSYTLSTASRNTLITTSVIGKHLLPRLQAQMRNPRVDSKILTHCRRHFCHCAAGICALQAPQGRHIRTNHPCPISAVEHSSTHTHAHEGEVQQASDLPHRRLLHSIITTRYGFDSATSDPTSSKCQRGTIQTQTHTEWLEGSRCTADHSNQTSTSAADIPIGRITKIKAAADPREGPRVGSTNEPG